MPMVTWRAAGSDVRCIPSSVIRPSRGSNGLSVPECPSRCTSPSMVGFQKFHHVQVAGTTNANSKRTARSGGSGAMPATAWWTCW